MWAGPQINRIWPMVCPRYTDRDILAAHARTGAIVKGFPSTNQHNFMFFLLADVVGTLRVPLLKGWHSSGMRSLPTTKREKSAPHI
jgi:hypothetical protein